MPLLLAACVVDLLVAAGAAGGVQAVEEQTGGGTFGDVVEELGGLLAFGARPAEDAHGFVPRVLRVGQRPGELDRVAGQVGQGGVLAVPGQQACQCLAGLGEIGFEAFAFGCAFRCFGGRHRAACLVLGEAHVVHGLDAGEGGGRGQVQEDLQQTARQSVGGDLAQQCLVAAGRQVDRPEVGGPPVGLGAGLLEAVDQGLQIHPPQHQAGDLLRVAVGAGGSQQDGDAPVRGGAAYVGQGGRVGAGQDGGRGDLPVGEVQAERHGLPRDGRVQVDVVQPAADTALHLTARRAAQAPRQQFQHRRLAPEVRGDQRCQTCGEGQGLVERARLDVAGAFPGHPQPVHPQRPRTCRRDDQRQPVSGEHVTDIVDLHTRLVRNTRLQQCLFLHRAHAPPAPCACSCCRNAASRRRACSLIDPIRLPRGVSAYSRVRYCCFFSSLPLFSPASRRTSSTRCT